MKIIIDVEMHHADPDAGNALRIKQVNAELDITLENDDDADLFDLCTESFKKYCVVTQSVINGVPVRVDIRKT